MKLFAVSQGLAGFLLLAAVSAVANQEVRVTRDHANLRSGPDDEADVVSQVSRGMVLSASVQEGDWTKVVSPDSADLWVYSELVSDGAVSVSKLLVRGGPGINYKPIGSLEMGDSVVIRGSLGDWLRIAPPAGCFLWTNSKFLEQVAAPAPRVVAASPQGALVSSSPPPPATSAGRVAERSDEPARPSARDVRPTIAAPRIIKPEPAVEEVPEISKDKLVSREGQGKSVEYAGVLRPAGIVLRRPSKYRLVSTDDKGRVMNESYLLAGESVLKPLSGHRLVVSGHEYWVQGVRYSVVVPEQIVQKD